MAEQEAKMCPLMMAGELASGRPTDEYSKESINCWKDLCAWWSGGPGSLSQV